MTRSIFYTLYECYIMFTHIMFGQMPQIGTVKLEFSKYILT